MNLAYFEFSIYNNQRILRCLVDAWIEYRWISRYACVWWWYDFRRQSISKRNFWNYRFTKHSFSV